MMRFILGLILILAGLSALFGFSFVKLIVAIILVVIGIRIISGRKHYDWQWMNKTASQEDTLNEVAIFSPLNKLVESENFHGGKVTMIFSGGELNLGRVKPSAREIDIEIVAVFSGLKLVIPEGWQIKSKGAAIFGGYNNRVEKSEGETILNIKGAAIFGGIEITN